MKPGAHADVIDEAARAFDERAAGTAALATGFTMRGRVAVVDAAMAKEPFDKTDLLLAGQTSAPVSMVRDSGYADDRRARSARAGTSSSCSRSAAACRPG